MSMQSSHRLALALRSALVCAVALTLLAVLPACRRRRVARTATLAPAESTAPAVALATTARRALDCPDYEGWPLAPRLVLVQGCGRIVELFMVDDAGSLWLPIPSLAALASEQLRCDARLLESVVLPGVARSVTGCGRSRDFELRCAGAACSWRVRGSEATVPEGYASVDGGTSPSSPAPAAQTDSVPSWAEPASVAAVTPSSSTPVAPTRPGPEAAQEVRERVESSREALRRCAWGSYTIRARWSRDGAIAYSLSPPLAGTPAELCVRATLGDAPVVTEEGGEVDVVVR